MKLLLDTCTFLWILGDDPALSGRAREAFSDPANEVYLSAVSAWEIALKHAAGKLPLPASPSEIVPTGRAQHQIEPLPFDEPAALTLARLPALHRDPFDRALVAQAIMGGLALVTPDPLITQYPVPILW